MNLSSRVCKKKCMSSRSRSLQQMVYGLFSEVFTVKGLVFRTEPLPGAWAAAAILKILHREAKRQGKCVLTSSARLKTILGVLVLILDRLPQAWLQRTRYMTTHLTSLLSNLFPPYFYDFVFIHIQVMSVLHYWNHGEILFISFIKNIPCFFLFIIIHPFNDCMTLIL